MKQENKDLLLKDLSARLFYGVKMNHIADDEHSPVTLVGINEDYIILQGGGYSYVPVEDYKPYLYPLSSISDEIIDEIYNNTGIYDIDSFVHIEVGTKFKDLTKVFDILHKHHIDYLGWIEKDLAIDATGLNIYKV